MSRAGAVLAVLAGAWLSGCAARSPSPEVAAYKANLRPFCAAAEVRYCDRRSDLPCQCLPQRDIEQLMDGWNR